MCVPASYISVWANREGGGGESRHASRQVDPNRRRTHGSEESARLPGLIGDVIARLEGADVESWGWEGRQI